MCFNYIYQITILKVEKLFIPFLVSCVTGGKIVLISKVNFVLLRLKQKKQNMITSVKLMLNKSRILNNGSYPLVFQVIHGVVLAVPSHLSLRSWLTSTKARSLLVNAT